MDGLFFLMWCWTGNAFEGFDAQRHWGVHSISNFWDLLKFVIAFCSPTAWHDYRGSVLDRGAFILMLYCLPVLWRLDKSALAWIYILGIIPAMSGTFISSTRYLSCAFPVFIVLGVVFSRRELKLARYALLSLFGALHAILLWRFVNFRWAG